MNRKTIIFLSIIFAIILTIGSIAATLYVSWWQAKNSEMNRLSIYAEQITGRITKSLSDSRDILKSLQILTFAPCSKEHIEKMQTLVFNTKIISEIGYFEDGLLKCNSWGMVNQKVKRVSPDLTKNGIDVALGLHSIVSPSKNIIAVSYKNYNALIDPDHFNDIIADPEVQIALVLHNGKMAAGFNIPSDLNLQTFNEKTLSKHNLMYVLNNPLYKVIVFESQKNVFKRWSKELKLFAPFGALMALGLIGVVIWVSRRRLSPIGELKAAIDRHEFEAHYQPIIELKSGKCIGAEALIRWRRADNTWERPDLFITLAEENNLIEAITDQLITMTISELKDLFRDREFHVSINFAAIDFKTGRILKVLNEALIGTDILPSQLWVESTERSFMDANSVLKTLTSLHELGYPIAIDDFGTGYSSLSYLEKFPLDIIKIDKSFVDSVGKESATSHVIDHIISMAKSLKLKIVAEGVEDQTQVEYLLKNEVDYVQGWLYAKALPLNEFTEFYKHHT